MLSQQVLLLLLLPLCSIGITLSSASRLSSHRTRRSGVFDVTFSYDEESIMRARQGETLERLAQLLPGRDPRQVRRRCAELGLRCEGNLKAPEGMEQWRRLPRAHRPGRAN